MRNREKLNIFKYIILPVIGLLFTVFYIMAASVDVVYSDYIRLINEYLPDVTDAGRLLVPDILTRIPATFLARLVNVRSFSYSVTFDRLLSVLGLAVMAYSSARYMYRHEVSFKWQLAFYIVLFSLNKWEILLNGTAWPHMVSFGMFFAEYRLLDLVWRGESDARQELAVCSMPLLALLFAGEYIAAFSCTVILMCIMGILLGGANSMAGRREQSLFKHVLLSAVLALLLYMLSRHFAVWEHAGATDMTLFELITTDPRFLLKFVIKSFAGTVFGEDVVNSFVWGGSAMPGKAVLAVGMLVIIAYLLAFILYFANDMLERTLFPLMLMISGLANHGLVAIGRWIFLNDSYGLSSRYGGQFMVGILGMLLVFALSAKGGRHLRRADEKKRRIIRTAAGSMAILIIAGNCYTDYRELRLAGYRKENYILMSEAIVNYESYSEEELLSILEWHKDAKELYSAIEILKNNRLNVFRVPQLSNTEAASTGETI